MTYSLGNINIRFNVCNTKIILMICEVPNLIEYSIKNLGNLGIQAMELHSHYTEGLRNRILHREAVVIRGLAMT